MIDTIKEAVEILLGSKISYAILIVTASATLTILLLDGKLSSYRRRKKLYKLDKLYKIKCKSIKA